MVTVSEHSAAVLNDGIFKKYISVFSSIFISLCYCYMTSSRIPKGLLRLISLLPVIGLFAILPLYVPHIISIRVITSILIWQANFGLILFAFGQGPLSSAGSLYMFIIHAVLPVRDPSSKLRTRKPSILSTLGVRILSIAILIGVTTKYKQRLHPQILSTFYGMLFFLNVDFRVGFSKRVCRVLLGVELEPTFDEPYLSTSLQDFWGRRWNLVVTNMLGRVVYRPVRLVSAAVLGSDLSTVPAILASFVVSGLVHELSFYYMTRANPSWETTAYFLLHGVCVALEVGIKKRLKGRLDLPAFLSVPLTLGFLFWTTSLLYFPPLTRNGVDAKLAGEFRSLMDVIKKGITMWNHR